ncbi:MAG: nitroreductase [Oscillospiraceae bacterium]|nr:nitroreductase [Oscillospiraceae bacterium]
MSAVMENILTRRSCRSYSAKQLSEEQLGLILKAGLWAPSGMNRQPWQFTVVQSPENLARLDKTVLKSMGAQERGSFFYHAPTLVMVSAPEDVFTAAADCALALGNMMLEAHELGAASCWIHGVTRTRDDREVRELLTELGVPPEHAVLGSLALGFADGPYKEVPRKDVVVLRK